MKDYAKWQLLYQYLSYVDTETLSIANEIQRIAFGKNDDERAITCVQVVEEVVPLALSRVFVENLLPDGVTVRLQ